MINTSSRSHSSSKSFETFHRRFPKVFLRSMLKRLKENYPLFETIYSKWSHLSNKREQKLSTIRKWPEPAEFTLISASPSVCCDFVRILEEKFTSPAQIMLHIERHIRTLPIATEQQSVDDTQKALDRLE
ncbi:hypothetical protein TYRP_017621 [Tyrophagus putrescentiae]|nr:hypothetical protein TYRP_017621 [Tyrophagus putrescentiae]